tara:strand:- start:9220 stop:9843 length:624 start_codon:yes stop_codon:yes gene_type:complete
MPKRKTTKSKPPAKPDGKPVKSDPAWQAQVVLLPESQATVALHSIIPKNDKGDPEVPLPGLHKELKSIADAVNSGDVSRPERVAISQITVLDRLFARLIEIAFQNLARGQFESLLRVALKAQSQCARTIETLAALKNPAVIARQFNLANQQVVQNGPIQPPETPQESANELNAPPQAIENTNPANSSFCTIQKSPAQEMCREMRQEP